MHAPPIPTAPPVRRHLLEEVATPLSDSRADCETPYVTGVDPGLHIGLLSIRGHPGSTRLTYAGAATDDGGFSLTDEAAGSLEVEELPEVFERALGHPCALDGIVVSVRGHCSTMIKASLRTLADARSLAVVDNAGVTGLIAHADALMEKIRETGFTHANAAFLNAVSYAALRPEGFKNTGAPGPQGLTITPARFHSSSAYKRRRITTVHADASFVHWGRSAAACAMTDTQAWAATDVPSATRIVDAELAGIAEAVRLAVKSTAPAVDIYCDSKPALQLLKKARDSNRMEMPPHKPARQPITAILDMLEHPSCPDIRFHWEPGHSGIAANEACDRVARHLARCAGAGVLDEVTNERLAEILADETMRKVA